MKKNILFIFFLCSTNLVLFAQHHSPTTIVEASLAAYNTRQIDEFMSYFSKDVEMKELNDSVAHSKGIQAVRAIFEPFFNSSPDLHSTIVNRIALGNKVIDHESITGANGNKEAFEVVVIYEIESDKIIRMTMVRK